MPASDPRVVAEVAEETADERGLADARLAGDEHDTALAARSSRLRGDQRRQCPVSLQELHTATITARRVVV